MKKVMIVSHVSGFLAQFELNNVKILQRKGYEVHYASNFKNSVYENESSQLKELGVIPHHIDFMRNPFSIHNSRAYRQLKQIMKKEQFELVHCHTPVGGAIGRLAARRCRVGKVIYTAHGFHFYKGASLVTWLIFYPIERALAWFTDILITINKEDYSYASNFRMKKDGHVLQIPGVGLDFERIQTRKEQREQIRTDLGISQEDFVLVSVGEVNRNKNQQVVVRALDVLKNKNIIYLICGKGDNEKEIKELIESSPYPSNIKMLGYQKDVTKYLNAADCFVFPSIREGLGMAALEGMACGLPLIASDCRGTREYAEQGKTGYVCEAMNVEQFAKAIDDLYKNQDLAKKMGAFNQKKAEQFGRDAVTLIMEKAYGE